MKPSSKKKIRGKKRLAKREQKLHEAAKINAKVIALVKEVESKLDQIISAMATREADRVVADQAGDWVNHAARSSPN